jgi:hypothetical protein
MNLDEIYKTFQYKDGNLFRKGKQVGFLKKPNNRQYLAVMYKYKEYYVHQIVYLMHYGYIPKVIDHIDGNGLNNNISNLRACTQAQNCQNSKKRKDNSSGVKGVYWNTTRKKWIADFIFNGQRKILGQFDSLEIAKQVIEKARKKYHGEFARNE